ncbi:MAG: VanZ family protein [Promethearchaeota archaeon]
MERVTTPDAFSLPKYARVLRVVPVFVVGAVIFYFSSLSDPLPAGTGPGRQVWNIDISVVLHLCEFGLFSVCTCLALWSEGDRGAPKWAIPVIGVAWGVLDEVHQLFVPNRVFDMADMLVDATGVLLGFLGFWLLARAWRARVAGNGEPATGTT